VEGAELDVLRGGVLARDRPLVLFECGPGVPQAFGQAPGDLFDLLAGQSGCPVFFLKDLLGGGPPVDRQTFVEASSISPFKAFNRIAVPPERVQGITRAVGAPGGTSRASIPPSPNDRRPSSCLGNCPSECADSLGVDRFDFTLGNKAFEYRLANEAPRRNRGPAGHDPRPLGSRIQARHEHGGQKEARRRGRSAHSTTRDGPFVNIEMPGRGDPEGARGERLYSFWSCVAHR